MSLLGLMKGKGASGFGFNSTAEDVTEGQDLSGKTYLLTGCNSGIGAETLRVLALRGATVIGAARTAEKAAAAVADHAGAIGVACELSEPASVRACVAEVKALDRPLDGIICNAGIMGLPKLTLHHGYELQFLTNHIGHFILTTGLLDQLTDDGRVVMLSSEGHRFTVAGGVDFDGLDGSKGYDQWRSYGQSKLSNLLFAVELARRFEGSGKRAYGVHPGVIVTNLGRHMGPMMQSAFRAAGPVLFTKTIPQGAATQTYVATHPDATLSGAYWSDCNSVAASAHGQDAALAERLWEASEGIVAAL
ncbi:MAG: NAD(P)-dependent dehydrogenase (short-subunit alcohol dehydrogenase family) [Myxococcota bacterium]|jgi:NAD(P)-dependent dehydrogenase (short-subunit alcohol dehydrogenase family)